MTIRNDVAFAVATWVEVLLYGVYTCLFVMAMSVMFKRRASDRKTASARIFLIATILMFNVATFHVALGLYRFLRAFVLLVDPQGAVFYINDTTRWDFTANNVLLSVMTWLGDALVIYRCYFVWNNNVLIIALPALLLITAVAINVFTIYWFTNPTIVSNPLVILPWFDTIYPLALVQNVMTTSLILLKIWKQHRASSASGAIDRSSRPSLMLILRIIIESAVIYTLQIFILVILYFRLDNAQFIVQAAIVPSIGIVFVLIAVRVHIAKTRTTVVDTGLGTIPPWLDDNDSAIELSRSSVGITFKVPTEELDHSTDDQPAASSSSYGEQKARPIHRFDSDTEMQ